ncbi:aminotransferase class IV [Parvibaculum sp.]|jgi:branched-chain amino acid aminotransferase|uniref:aminotransferase class IV n=1 Tax=Parvibaculum sp. TaxID=2024848 RepID=UPI0034865CF2
MKLWLNGTIADAGDTRIDPADRGLLLGDGLFETMLVRKGRIAFFEEHLLRLTRGAETIGLMLPYSPDELLQACRTLLQDCGLLESERASLRLTLTRGPGPRGLALPPDPKPTVLISAAAGGQPPDHISLATVSPRRNPWSPSARLKALPYLDNVLAKEEARKKGADDALILDTNGLVACSSAANIFLWDGDLLLTPGDRSGILPGITRAVLLELTSSIGVEAREDDIKPQRLLCATGVFITNSLMGLVPVSRIDGQEIPAHPMTARLAAAYELLLDAAASGN